METYLGVDIDIQSATLYVTGFEKTWLSHVIMNI